MKTINLYLNEAKKEYRNVKYAGIPVKELYKALVNGIIKEVEKYNIPDTPYWDNVKKTVDTSKPNIKTSLFIAQSTWISKDKSNKPISAPWKNNQWDYSELAKLYNDLFTENWDSTVSSDRQMNKEYDGTRSYFTFFYFPGYKICNNCATGALKELSKYIVSKE